MPQRLALALVLTFILATPAMAEPPFRVRSEDAFAYQCVNGVCSTVQVTRSTFSTGVVETILFFSAYDDFGNPISVLGVPSGYTQIPSEHFVMNRRGTIASLTYAGVTVVWKDTDDYHAEANSTEIVRQKGADGRFTRSRVSERSQQLSADAEGAVGPIVINTAATLGVGEFGSASLTTRKTVSRTKVSNEHVPTEELGAPTAPDAVASDP
jgi:hypothetical protein